jgi:MFS family permease
LQGLFAAFITSCSLTIIKTTFSGAEETLAIGIWAAIIGVGNAIGPFIGGFITTYLGWRYIFWLNLLPIGFSIIITMLLVQSSIPAKQKKRIDYIGAFWLVTGLFMLIFALVKGNTWGFLNIKTIAFFISGIIILLIFKMVEKEKEHAIINFIYLRNKLFLFASFGIFIAIGYSIGIPYFLNLYLQNSFVLGFSPMVAGATLLPFSFSILIASVLLPKISMKINPYYIMPAALIILAFGLLGLAFGILAINYKLIFLFLIVSGLGIGLIMPAFPKIALNNFSTENIGQGSGFSLEEKQYL